MSFWKKIFGKKDNQPSSSKVETHFDTYRAELHELGFKTMEDLEKLVHPLIRHITKIEVQPASRPPENSQSYSHFGGQAYFEKGESWPQSKSGKPLDFIFQIYNDSPLELPEDIALIQLYYDWDEFPWDTGDDGWLVKIYKDVDEEKRVFIERPAELERSKYCEIKFQPSKSLPNWEGIFTFSDAASKLSCVLDEDEPWDSYGKIVTKLIGEQDYRSQLGGYPHWVQGESTPKNNAGEPMKLLFQIDSEDNAGLMWGDVGLIYVFYDEANGKIEFILQCH